MQDVPATFEDGPTTKVIPGEGTYTVAPDGTVTLYQKIIHRNRNRRDQQRVDKNGTPVTHPNCNPAPTAEPTTQQISKVRHKQVIPTFTPGNPDVPMDEDVPATFEDGSTTKVIPGEANMYTVAPDGTVTSVPENHSQEQEQA